MNSKFLHFLFVLACAAFIGLGPMRAQNSASTTDANGSAVSAPARTPEATSVKGTDSGVVASQKAADNAVANDRGTVPANQKSPYRVTAAWVGILGVVVLAGVLMLFRRRGAARQSAGTELDQRPADHHRAA
jgi:cobalamin biosynthesis Mg chelatase CobN